MKKFFESAGITASIIGVGGIAGAIEFETSLIKPIIVILVGCGLIAISNAMEVVKDKEETINRNSNNHYRNSASRPYYLCK